MLRRCLLSVSALLAACGNAEHASGPTGPDAANTADSADATVAADSDATPDAPADGAAEVEPTTPDTVTDADATETDVSTWPPRSVGAPCTTAADCDGPNPACLELPGGYCAPDCTTTACPAGSTCYAFDDTPRCLATCDGARDCRFGEDHVCDEDGTCWWYEGVSPGTSPIGGPCLRDGDCIDTGATCNVEGFGGNANGFVGGYCLIIGCNNDCPAGSTCVGVGGANRACMASCGTTTACPQALGYGCDSETDTCWPGCGEDSECPPGHGCDPSMEACNAGYSSAPFTCTADSLEPDDTKVTPRVIDPPTQTPGTFVRDDLSLCTDEDWYKLTFPAATLGTVGIEFPHPNGDLDLIAYDENGALLGSRLGPETYGAASRTNENDLEYHSILSMPASVTGLFHVRGYGNAQNHYALHVATTSWIDDALCTDHFPADECRGYNGKSTGIVYHFPFPRADDPYVPNGYTLESYSSYRWLRRELIMLVRAAIHEVQLAFPETRPLGLIDMGDRDAVTPGFDIGDPRHPESTHDQGGNIDIAYYQTDGDSSGSIVCGPNESDNDGYYCTSVARHVVDLPRTVYFMAMLNRSPRVRVIGVDKLLAPLIIAEANRQKAAGTITSALAQRVIASLAYGDGWPFHHHHMHVSMRWWDDDAPTPSGLAAFRSAGKNHTPALGCGYRMPGDGPLSSP